MQLFHGSKSGIKGKISPIGRPECDFGKGFYMGTDKEQPLTLICNYPHPVIYTLQFNFENLKVKDLKLDIDWALLVAYNRGKMENIRHSALYDKIGKMISGYDVVSGYIANDRMFVVLDRFFNGDITDVALIKSLSALKLGKQYVAKTERACSAIEIIEQHVVTEHEKQELKAISDNNRKMGVSLANMICRQHRREGRYFDEILEEGE